MNSCPGRAALRVLVDLSRLRPGGEGGGIKPALKELLAWLGRQPDLEFVLLGPASLQRELASWLHPSARLIGAEDAPADLAAREKCDLVYCPFGITEWACAGIPVITLIVDLLHRDFPETLAEPDRRFREEQMQAAGLNTDLYQAISDYTAGQLQKHYAVPSERIIRTYLPIHTRLGASSQPANERAEESPYFFYPANAWAHKNHETLLVAYSLYLQKATAQAWGLVLTGHQDARMERLRKISATLGLSQKVDFRGYVDEGQLATLWDHAGALVFPSLHEGFGIPLLEAMARGVPIIASDATAVPEITADAALLVEARTPATLADAMLRMAQEPQLRRDLVNRGLDRQKNFTADSEFGRLLDHFHRVAAAPAVKRYSGFHPVDGLVEPLAIFGLPVRLPYSQSKLFFSTRPLGIARTLEFWNGAERLESVAVAPDRITTGELALPSDAKTLTLRVPDASRLSQTDPRTHGVLLGRLQIVSAEFPPVELVPGFPPL